MLTPRRPPDAEDRAKKLQDNLTRSAVNLAVTKEELKEARETVRALKESTTEAQQSESAISDKLAYEKRVRRDLEIDLVVAMQTLQNDQVAIAGMEVEMADLKRAAEYIMDMVVPQEDPEKPIPVLDRLLVAPEKTTKLLRETNCLATSGALIRVKSHYPEVDMSKIMDGPNTAADLDALEVEVDPAARKIVEGMQLVEEDQQM